MHNKKCAIDTNSKQETTTNNRDPLLISCNVRHTGSFVLCHNEGQVGEGGKTNMRQDEWNLQKGAVFLRPEL